MPDWTKSMQQTFDYYVVDPDSWQDTTRLTNITSCSITRDSSQSTLGSATFDIVGSLDGDVYIRPYLVTVQNGIRERFALGTFLAQAPSLSFDGKTTTGSIDAYTPLIELTETHPPLGYSIFKNSNVMENAYNICREHLRAPVISTTSTKTLYSDFVANTDDTWLTFLSDLIANDKRTFGLDELCRITFEPNQVLDAMMPRYAFDDGTASILYSDISTSQDLFEIPNVVTVVYSSGYYTHTVTVKNEDSNSETSIQSRGREIEYVETNPSITGSPTKGMVEEYAQSLLESKSTVAYTINYSHGYCPVRLYDCVRLDCTKAGISNLRARVTSQTIDCSTGCKVTETAVCSKKYWTSGV